MANKKDLTKAVAEALGQPQKEAVGIVENIYECISNALSKGEDVKIVNFGKWVVKERAARKGRNPQTGEPMDIPAKNVIRFKAGKGLADAVNA